jgi:hypothetical protein
VTLTENAAPAPNGRRARLVGAAAAVAGVSLLGLALFLASPSSKVLLAGITVALPPSLLTQPTAQTYTAGPELPAPTGADRTTRYRLQLPADPEAQVRELAAALDLTGEVQGPTAGATVLVPVYLAGSTDRSGAHLSAVFAGTGPWSYVDPTASAGTGRPIDAGEAAEQAAALFTATGQPAEASQVQVREVDGWTVATFAVPVDGEPTALEWVAVWAETGKLSQLNGHLMILIADGTDLRVSPAEAVQRLGDRGWWGLGAGDLQWTPPASGQTAGEPPQPGRPGPVSDELVVDGAQPAWVLTWSVDGQAWLLPGYRLSGQQWAVHVVGAYDAQAGL